ncbi:hypothetical protein AAKU67_004148 [Oxalobacteraceae bacterium GrIS 2.11]
MRHTERYKSPDTDFLSFFLLLFTKLGVRLRVTVDTDFIYAISATNINQPMGYFLQFFGRFPANTPTEMKLTQCAYYAHNRRTINAKELSCQHVLI